MKKIDDIIHEVELWRDKNGSYEPLNGGLSNYTYKIDVNGTFYVLRVNGGQNDFLALNKTEETKAMQKAFTAGIGAEIYSDESNEQYIITKFNQGTLITSEQAHNPFYIEKFANILIKTHAITGVNRSCSPFYLIDRYLQGAKSLNVVIPTELNAFLEKIDEIERRSTQNLKYTERYCHNDFYNINMLDDNGDICLIDWELSGMGNIFFDLATISFSNAYSSEEDRLLLSTYFGYFEDELTILLHDMKYMNMLREITWALLHSGMDVKKINHSFDYLNNAMWFLEKLKNGYVTV